MPTTIARRLPTAPHAGYWPGVVATALTTTVAVMPGYTVGALDPVIQRDLHVSGSAVG